MNDDMGNDDEIKDYEVGYKKPPKSGQFKKGVSGNPSGRPKRASDLHLKFLQELNSRVPISENGRRKNITKFEVVAKQLIHKAATGSVQAQRLTINFGQQAQERVEEQEKNAPKKLDITVLRPEDLSDEDLARYIGEGMKQLKDTSGLSERLQQRLKQLK